MNYFDGLTFEKGVITVLGVEKNSEFVKELYALLSGKGSVVVTDTPVETDADYTVIVPDKNSGRCFIMHTDSEAEEYRRSSCVIGIVSADVLEKKICQAVIGAERFAAMNDLTEEELIFPLALARVIEKHEKYDILYIDDVYNEGKRYLARELGKRLCNGTVVRMINTDNPYVEMLVNPKA